MKRVLLLALFLLAATCGVSRAAVNAGVSLSNGGNSFYLSIGDYFQAPQKEIVYVRERNIPDEEIPVVFYLARQARVAPSVILDLRLKGGSWTQITTRYGLGPEIFYVPVSTNVSYGPPYGHAYGYYKNKPKKEWHKIKLGDADIVNLVNLKFMSEHYKSSPETIMKMRGNKKGFNAISDDLEKQRKENGKNSKAAPAEKTKSQNKYNGEKQNKSDNKKGGKNQGGKDKNNQKGDKHGNNGKK